MQRRSSEKFISVCRRLSPQSLDACSPPRTKKRLKGWVKSSFGEKRPHKYKVLLFLFLLALLLPSGEGAGYGNTANFLLDSRHILNYSATFYFKLTNKETLHPTAYHISLGHLMLPPSRVTQFWQWGWGCVAIRLPDASSFCLSMCLCIHVSMYLSLSFYHLSMYLSVYLLSISLILSSPSISLFFVFSYLLCAHMFLYVYMHMDAHVWACMWRPEVDVSTLFFIAFVVLRGFGCIFVCMFTCVMVHLLVYVQVCSCAYVNVRCLSQMISTLFIETRLLSMPETSSSSWSS